MNKAEIRKKMQLMRNSLSVQEVCERSRMIQQQVISHPAYESADQILSYVNMGKEVETRCIMETALEEGKTVAVPKIIEKQMYFFRMKSLNELVLGHFGILEPAQDITYPMEAVYPSKHTLLIVPGLAFDQCKHRLGYGGGYYDRYFSEHKSGVKMALAYLLQLVDSLPTEPFDVPVDLIMTENGCNEEDN